MSKSHDKFIRYVRVYNTLFFLNWRTGLDDDSWEEVPNPEAKEEFFRLYAIVDAVSEVCGENLNETDIRKRKTPFSRRMYNKVYDTLWGENAGNLDYYNHIYFYLDYGGKL